MQLFSIPVTDKKSFCEFEKFFQFQNVMFPNL